MARKKSTAKKSSTRKVVGRPKGSTNKPPALSGQALADFIWQTMHDTKAGKTDYKVMSSVTGGANVIVKQAKLNIDYMKVTGKLIDEGHALTGSSKLLPR